MNGRADAASGTAGRVTPAVGGNSGVGPAQTSTSPSREMGTWPLSSYLALGAMPSAVPCARLHVRQVLWEWGLDPLADDIELVVSELVTNAMQASQELGGYRWRGEWIPGPSPIRLWLRADYTNVLVQVWDGSDRLPRRQEPEPYREGGHGLLLVEALCQRYGTYALDGCSGKLVWGEIGS